MISNLGATIQRRNVTRNMVGTNITHSGLDDWRNISFSNNVGSEFMSPNVRISPILDTDASRFLYGQRNDQYDRYNQYLRNTVGITRTIDGDIIMNDRRSAHTPASLPMTGGELAAIQNPEMNINTSELTEKLSSRHTRNTAAAMDDIDEQIFLANPLTLLNLTKIDLTSCDVNTRINSFVKIGMIIWGTVYVTNNYDIINQSTLIIAVIVGIIMVMANSKNRALLLPDREDFSSHLSHPPNFPAYQPRDILTSKQNIRRNFSPHKINAHFGDRPYPSSMIRY